VPWSGGAHVTGGGDKTKIFIFKEHSSKEINDRCMTCHAGGTQHMNALNSVHAKNNVSCTSCHSPHHAKDSEFLLVKAQPELCVSCHLKLVVRDFHSPEVQKESDAELTDIIAKGKNKMPAYEKSLKPEEIKGLASYVRSLGAKK
jgi:predicted CXXCH cytochrome family protein